MILNENPIHQQEEQRNTDTGKYFLIGVTADADPVIDPDELLLVQEIECPAEYQQELFKMMSCQVVIEKAIKDLDSLVLRCSICRKNFALLDQLIEHKKRYKICNNNLSKMKVSFKKIIRRKRYEDYERHKFFKSKLNSFYY